MENFSLLVKDLLEVLRDGKITRSEVKEKIESSNVGKVQKRGLINLLVDTDSCKTNIECIEKLENLDVRAMGKAIALFEKVPEDVFLCELVYKDIVDVNEVIYDEVDMYKNVSIPKRSSKGRAGYDFTLPYDIILRPGKEMYIVTGIRCCMDEDWVLKVYPRRDLSSEYCLQFVDAIPVISSDDYDKANMGQIIFKISNNSKKSNNVLRLEKGSKLCQGIFSEYGVTFDVNDNGVSETEDIEDFYTV